MTTAALFWLTVGPAVAGVVLALLADAFAPLESPASSIAGALMLAGGAVAAITGGVTLPTSDAVEGFRVGGGVSTAAGLVMALAAMMLASAVSSDRASHHGYAPLASLAATGASLAVMSDDLLLTVLALETVSVCAYALVASARTRESTESAMKYFVQGAVATGFLVLGTVILAVIVRGDLGYVSLFGSAELLGVTLPVTVGLVLVLAAVAFKAGAAPFHAWVPDAYGSSSPSAAGVLAGPVKLAAAAALSMIVMRAVPVSGDVFEPGSALGDVLPVLAVVAVASMVIGSLGALGQRSYARMLGYAGVAQVGYAIVAVTSLNSSAAAVHLAVYAVAVTGAFAAAGAIDTAHGGWNGDIDRLHGLAQRRPLLAAGLAVCMVSLAGIPPLAGFWGKFQAFGAGVSAASTLLANGSGWQGWMYILLVTAGVVSSVVSVAYYGGVVRAAYTPDDADDAVPVGRASRPNGAEVVVLVIAVALILAGAAPFLVGLTESMTPFIY